MTLQEAVDEKRERRRQLQIVADHKGNAAVELLRAQARVGRAKRRAERHAGAPACLAEVVRQDFIAEVEHFEHRRVIAQEWDVLAASAEGPTTDQTGAQGND